VEYCTFLLGLGTGDAREDLVSLLREDTLEAERGSRRPERSISGRGRLICRLPVGGGGVEGLSTPSRTGSGTARLAGFHISGRIVRLGELAGETCRLPVGSGGEGLGTLLRTGIAGFRISGTTGLVRLGELRLFAGETCEF